MGPSGSDRESVASVIILAGAIALADGAGAGESTRPDLFSGSTFKISARIFISVAGQRRKAERQLNLEGLCSLDNKPTVAGHSNVPIREHLFFFAILTKTYLAVIMPSKAAPQILESIFWPGRFAGSRIHAIVRLRFFEFSLQRRVFTPGLSSPGWVACRLDGPFA